ncbi:MAG: hypothetical protein Q8O34_11195 [Rhodocyclaceae bacterium]|nr:hypothetical protein [Rhodocyclaceae bacterium]
MIAAPDAPITESIADQLREELSALIETIEEMQTKTGPLLIARYQATLGRLEIQLLELQIEAQATRRRVELLQAGANLGKPVTPDAVAAMEQQITAELAEWRQRLEAQERVLAAACDFLAGIVLVDSDEAKRVKAAYRKLARWLHPDASPRNSDLFEKYWPAVQDAYQRLDVDLIEALLHLIERALQERSGLTPAGDTPAELARLRRLVAAHAERLVKLKSEPPHCHVDLLNDHDWIAARQAALERAIAGESERLAQLLMRLAALMARNGLSGDGQTGGTP